MAFVFFFQNSDPSGGGCPTITLSDLTAQPYMGEVYSDSVAPSAGDAPYNLSVTSGDLPDGLSLNSGTGAITGTPTVFDIFNFTIGGTDANGCAITPREYTIEVRARFTNDTPVPITDESQMLIEVSGIPGILGADVAIHSIEINITRADLSTLPIAISAPDIGGVNLASPPLTGSNITGAVFTPDATEPITSGSAPFTGEWLQSFADMDGNSASGTYILNAATEPFGGSIDSCTIILKPI